MLLESTNQWYVIRKNQWYVIRKYQWYVTRNYQWYVTSMLLELQWCVTNFSNQSLQSLCELDRAFKAESNEYS